MGFVIVNAAVSIGPTKKEVPGKKYVGISRITVIKTVTINTLNTSSYSLYITVLVLGRLFRPLLLI